MAEQYITLSDGSNSPTAHTIFETPDDGDDVHEVYERSGGRLGHSTTALQTVELESALPLLGSGSDRR